MRYIVIRKSNGEIEAYKYKGAETWEMIEKKSQGDEVNLRILGTSEAKDAEDAEASYDPFPED